MNALLEFLDQLEEKKISYELSAPSCKKMRPAIMVTVNIPGQRWEVEFMLDGSLEIEKFVSNGEIYDEHEIDVLFRDYSD
jgi:hypothetical protein